MIDISAHFDLREEPSTPSTQEDEGLVKIVLVKSSSKLSNQNVKIIRAEPWLVWLSGLSAGLRTKGS